jgi:hypothetical protein
VGSPGIIFNTNDIIEERKTMKKGLMRMLGLGLLLGVGFEGIAAMKSSWPRTVVKDVRPDLLNDDRAVFSLPTDLAAHGGKIYVVDARDGVIRVYSGDGDYLREIGKPGQGPGEFNFPYTVDFYDEKIYVADSSNKRIQILSLDGRYLSGFRLMESPEQLIVLDEDTIVVSHWPDDSKRKENIIRCYDRRGKLLWEALDIVLTSDMVLDTLINQMTMLKTQDGGFSVVKKNDDRCLYHYGRTGTLLGKTEVDFRFAPKKVVLPLSGGPRTMSCFFWTAAFGEGRFFLVVPDNMEDGDIGPGREVLAVGKDGRVLEALVFPVSVKKLLPEEGRFYAVDTDNVLRVFEAGRK